VILKNGDKLTGKIVKMMEKKLEIDLDKASDNLTTKWEDVQSITSDEPLSIKLYGNVEIPVNIGERVGDRLNLHHLDEGGLVRLEDIQSINQPVHDYLAPSQPVGIRRPATRKLKP
jgi:hypothetical protein